MSLHSGIAVGVRKEVKRRTRPPYMSSRYRTSLLRGFNLVRTISTLFQFVRAMVRGHRNITIRVTIMPQTIHRLEQRMFRRPGYPLRIHTFSYGFLGKVLFRRINVLQTIRTVFRHHTLSQLGTPVIPRSSAMGVMGSFYLFGVRYFSPLFFK